MSIEAAVKRLAAEIEALAPPEPGETGVRIVNADTGGIASGPPPLLGFRSQ